MRTSLLANNQALQTQTAAAVLLDLSASATSYTFTELAVSSAASVSSVAKTSDA